MDMQKKAHLINLAGLHGKRPGLRTLRAMVHRLCHLTGMAPHGDEALRSHYHSL